MPKDLGQDCCLEAGLQESRQPECFSAGLQCREAPPIRKTQMPPKSGPLKTRYQCSWRNSLVGFSCFL